MRNTFLLLALLVVYASALKIDKATGLFIDEDSRYRVYHGVNVVYKAFPFYPPISDHFHANDSLADVDLENLRDWGFNVIRLHVAWEAFEPVRGQYNFTYLEQLKKIVHRCANYNISVLLDAHQDLLSGFFCGEGMPDWAMTHNLSFPFPIAKDIPKDEKGKPIIKECLKRHFGTYQFTLDVNKNFDRLYKNFDNIGDSFAMFWEKVAEYFANETVLGYEIINEPFGTSLYTSLKEFLIPGITNNKYLIPFYRKVHKSIRKHDNRTILFYEQSLNDILNFGFNETVGGEEYKDREVYSYHVYCPAVNSYGEPTNVKACHFMDQFMFWTKSYNIKQLGIGAFLTEFGALFNSKEAADEIHYVTQLADVRFHSWTYWQFKYYSDITTAASPGTVESFYDEFGNLQSVKVKALARPYAYAICGVPLWTNFNQNTAKYNLQWKALKRCNGKNTEVFLSDSLYYQKGFNVTFKGCTNCTLKAKELKGYYQVVIPEEQPEAKNIEMIISPK